MQIHMLAAIRRDIHKRVSWLMGLMKCVSCVRVSIASRPVHTHPHPPTPSPPT